MASIDQVFEKLESVENKINDFGRWQAGLDERCAAHREQTTEIRHTLFDGNGDAPGIKSKVALLWACKKEVVKWKDFWFGIIRGVVTACIVGFILWVLVVYKKG